MNGMRRLRKGAVSPSFQAVSSRFLCLGTWQTNCIELSRWLAYKAGSKYRYVVVLAFLSLRRKLETLLRRRFFRFEGLSKDVALDGFPPRLTLEREILMRLHDLRETRSFLLFELTRRPKTRRDP